MTHPSRAGTTKHLHVVFFTITDIIKQNEFRPECNGQSDSTIKSATHLKTTTYDINREACATHTRDTFNSTR